MVGVMVVVALRLGCGVIAFWIIEYSFFVFVFVVFHISVYFRVSRRCDGASWIYTVVG